VGVIAEVPVRLMDLLEILHDRVVPEVVMWADAEPEWPTIG